MTSPRPKNNEFLCVRELWVYSALHRRRADIVGFVNSLLLHIEKSNHPFDKQETKAALNVTIREILWNELPSSYSDESINHYRDAVYDYVNQRYGNAA